MNSLGQFRKHIWCLVSFCDCLRVTSALPPVSWALSCIFEILRWQRNGSNERRRQPRPPWSLPRALGGERGEQRACSRTKCCGVAASRHRSPLRRRTLPLSTAPQHCTRTHGRASCPQGELLFLLGMSDGNRETSELSYVNDINLPGEQTTQPCTWETFPSLGCKTDPLISSSAFPSACGSCGLQSEGLEPWQQQKASCSFFKIFVHSKSSTFKIPLLPIPFYPPSNTQRKEAENASQPRPRHGAKSLNLVLLWRISLSMPPYYTVRPPPYSWSYWIRMKMWETLGLKPYKYLKNSSLFMSRLKNIFSFYVLSFLLISLFSVAC